MKALGGRGMCPGRVMRRAFVLGEVGGTVVVGERVASSGSGVEEDEVMDDEGDHGRPWDISPRWRDEMS